MSKYQPLPTRSTGSWSSWWWQELLSVTASVACLAAVAVILSRMQDQPDADWTFVISLNATVAALVTAAESLALLAVSACIGQWKWIYYRSETRPLEDLDTIDDASRGPYGAVLLLAKSRLAGVATVGALVTILALGIDTFAQQVLSTEAVTTWLDNGALAATFSLATGYASGAQMNAAASLWAPIPYTVDSSMQGSIYQGLYSLQKQPVFQCASNCTWAESHLSLGFHAECQNVTAATYAARVCTADYDSAPLSGANCNMTTPGNVTFKIAMDPTVWTTVLVVKAVPLYPEYVTGVTHPDRRLPAAFTRLVVFRQPSEYAGYNASYIQQNQQALECDISLAAYNYTGASSSGSNFTFQSVAHIPLEDGHLIWDGIVADQEPNPYIIFNTTGLPVFNISTLDLGAIMAFFAGDSFSGTLVDGEDLPHYAQGITAALLSSPQQRNVTALMAAMATSMTDQLRAGAQIHQSAARGRTAKAVVLVRVQWAWLALPFAVGLASALFLCLVMFLSRESRGVGLWKSRATALLCHSVSGGSLTTAVGGPRELRRLVKQTSVRLT